MRHFATHLGTASPGGADLFHVLYSVVKDTLKVDDEAVLSVVHQRVARDHDCDDVTEALLEVEEGAQVLDRTDVSKISEAQKQAAAQLGAAVTYRESYTQKVVAVRSAAAKASGSGDAKKAKKTPAAAAPVRLVLPHHIDQ